MEAKSENLPTVSPERDYDPKELSRYLRAVLRNNMAQFISDVEPYAAILGSMAMPEGDTNKEKLYIGASDISKSESAPIHYRTFDRLGRKGHATLLIKEDKSVRINANIAGVIPTSEDQAIPQVSVIASGLTTQSAIETRDHIKFLQRMTQAGNGQTWHDLAHKASSKDMWQDVYEDAMDFIENTIGAIPLQSVDIQLNHIWKPEGAKLTQFNEVAILSLSQFATRATISLNRTYPQEINADQLDITFAAISQLAMATRPSTGWIQRR